MKTQLNSINLFNSSFFAILLASFLLAGCSENCIEGIGSPVTQTIELSDFTGIHLDVATDVIISQGETQEVKAIGEANIIDRLRTNVTNNVWNIDFENGCYRDYQLELQITIPNLESISIDGSGGIIINDFTNQDDLRFDIDGSGDIAMNAFEGLNTMTVEIGGSGTITTDETIADVDYLDIDIDGSGNFYGYPVESKDCKVRIEGSGSVEVTVENNLDVKIEGSGDVYYKGSPSITQDIGGSGNLINRN